MAMILPDPESLAMPRACWAVTAACSGSPAAAKRGSPAAQRDSPVAPVRGRKGTDSCLVGADCSSGWPSSEPARAALHLQVRGRAEGAVTVRCVARIVGSPPPPEPGRVLAWQAISSWSSAWACASCCKIAASIGPGSSWPRALLPQPGRPPAPHHRRLWPAGSAGTASRRASDDRRPLPRTPSIGRSSNGTPLARRSPRTARLQTPHTGRPVPAPAPAAPNGLCAAARRSRRGELWTPLSAARGPSRLSVFTSACHC